MGGGIVMSWTACKMKYDRHEREVVKDEWHQKVISAVRDEFQGKTICDLK